MCNATYTESVTRSPTRITRSPTPNILLSKKILKLHNFKKPLRITELNALWQENGLKLSNLSLSECFCFQIWLSECYYACWEAISIWEWSGNWKINRIGTKSKRKCKNKPWWRRQKWNENNAFCDLGGLCEFSPASNRQGANGFLGCAVLTYVVSMPRARRHRQPRST